MEEPSSPLSPHIMLSAHMRPALSSPGAVAPSLVPPAYPEVGQLPNAAATSAPPVLGGMRGLPKPRAGRFPSSSLRRAQVEPYSSGGGDETGQPMPTTINPMLHIRSDCHLFPPASNWDSQPITPSPRSSSKTLHDNSSGWTAVNDDSAMMCTHDGGPEGKRIGYDGTNQTPSVQLLKPTASSLGHRVHKPAASRSHQQQRWQPKSLHGNPHHLDSPCDERKPPSLTPNAPCFDNQNMRGCEVIQVTTFNDAPASTAIDPFGALDKSKVDDDEDMEENTQNSSCLLEEFEGFEIAMTDEGPHSPTVSGTTSKHPLAGPSPPPTSLSRCSTWSPGVFSGGANASGRECPERLRSYNIDPVASQLLRACAFHEEDEGYGGRESASCRSPVPRPSGSSLFSASMPDLQSPVPEAKHQGGRNEVAPMIAEGVPANYPLSPAPLFRDVSGSLRDVKTDDDIRSLARPVPRKLGVPAPAPGRISPRRSSLPKHFRHGLQGAM